MRGERGGGRGGEEEGREGPGQGPSDLAGRRTGKFSRRASEASAGSRPRRPRLKFRAAGVGLGQRPPRPLDPPSAQSHLRGK